MNMKHINQLAPTTQKQADPVEKVEITTDKNLDSASTEPFHLPSYESDTPLENMVDRFAEIMNDREFINRFKQICAKFKPEGIYWLDEEDIFQEALIRFWANLPAFREEANPSTFFYRIAKNVFIDIIRQSKADKHGGNIALSYIDSFDPDELAVIYQGEGDEVSIFSGFADDEKARLSLLTGEEREFIDEYFCEHEGNISRYSKALKERGAKGHSRPSIYKVLHIIQDKLRPSRNSR
jgi:RNA polymerase sigma factor (sigma-70 family)